MENKCRKFILELCFMNGLHCCTAVIFRIHKMLANLKLHVKQVWSGASCTARKSTE